jgi:uncharacterized membrane protein
MGKTFLRKIRNNFFTGLIVLLPLIITILLVRFLFNRINNTILEPGTNFLAAFFPQGHLVVVFKVLIFLIVVLLIALFGLATKNILGRRLFSLFERFVYKLPLVGKVYSGTKDISNALLTTSKGAFLKVVLVEFPQKGSYALGFVTSEVRGEIQDKTKEEVINVFVPTTPNPTSGFLLFVPKEGLIFLDMSVEDGLKLVISGGVVSPVKKVN